MRKSSLFWLFSTGVVLVVAGLLYARHVEQQNSVLKHIATLNERLSADNCSKEEDMQSTLRSIQQAVRENHNIRKDLAIQTESERLAARTQSLVDSIQAWQTQLQQESIGTRPAAASHRKNASQLRWHFSRYAAFVGRYFPSDAAQQLGISSRADWPFPDNAPLAVAVASLSIQEANVQRISAEAFQNLAAKVGRSWDTFEKNSLEAVPASAAVAPGKVYESLLFLSNGPIGLYPYPRMSVNGKTLKVNDDGEAKVILKAPPLQPGQPDAMRAQWQATIMAHLQGRDTSWQLTVPYFIVKHAAR